MLRLILSSLAIFLVYRLIQEKIQARQETIQQEKENGRVIEGEVVNDDNDSNTGE